MKSRRIDVNRLADYLLFRWYRRIAFDESEFFAMLNISAYDADALHRLFWKCEKAGISYEWTKLALVWYLNNI